MKSGIKSVNVARPKAIVNAILRHRVNAVKASACWVWKPKTKVIDHVSKHNSASITLKKYDYVNAQGRSNSSDDEALDKEDTSKQGRIDDIDADEDIALVISAAETIVTTAPTITAKSTNTNVEVQDKGKGKVNLIEEPKMPKKRKHQIRADKELAKQLQAKIDEKNRIAIEKAQQVEERRKFFAAKRAKEKINKSPTKAQQRSLMCTYLKNMDGWKPKALKNKFFAEIQELFDKAMKRINTFVDIKIEFVEESTKKDKAEIAQESNSKKTGDDLEQERSKKQKMEDDKESAELKKCLEIVPADGDDVTIDATPLYSNKLLKNFDREDLKVLWRLVKARFEKIIDNCKKGLGYNAVLPPHTGLFMPPKYDLSYIGLEEFTSKHAVETLNAKTSEDVPMIVKNDNGAPIIEDWKSDDEDETVPQPKIEMKTVKPSVANVEDVKGAPECMRIFGFVHRITNPEPIKRPHDKIPKTVDEMMRVTMSFLEREVAASSHERKKSFPLWRQQEGHNTDERRHLKKQIEEMLKTGKMSHLIKELKQNNEKEQLKAAKKGETSGKDKALAILMVQPWERMARQKITQSFSLNTKILFPPLDEDEGTKGPMIIEAEIEGRCIHRISRNAESPDRRRNNYPKEQQVGFAGMRVGLQTKRNLPGSQTNGGRKSPGGNKPRISEINTDMTSVPRHLAEHRLNIREGCPPVRQKNRGQTTNRNHAIHEEVGKLVEAGIMKEVHYHGWLSNPVMVKKHDDSWRMCVDFKDLNKACPKDVYPLPEIDWKVESLLRNVGAAYQCLVDKAFHKQIGRNIEVYVDDLVIKSRTKDEIVRDIEETFKTLRETNMKLNPKKCTFRVEEGMFLGYTVNTKELKVCPDKGIKRYGDKLYINREISARLGTFQQAPKEILSSTPDHSNYRPTVTTDISRLHSRTIRRGLSGYSDGNEKRTPQTIDLIYEWIILHRWFWGRTNSHKPKGMEFTYALRFRFDATNNEAEYEALIAGLRIAE
nr:retrotransposon protein, putative, Ty3-gypsy subclass [Tanacetum cinerariifolium]